MRIFVCNTVMRPSKHGEASLWFKTRTSEVARGDDGRGASAPASDDGAKRLAMRRRCDVRRTRSRQRGLARTSGGGAKRPAMGRCSNQPAQKKGRSRAEWWRGPALIRCCYAVASRTGIPTLRALSIILLVMPEPGKATRPFGRKFSRTSLRRKGAALPSRPQSGLQTTW